MCEESCHFFLVDFSVLLRSSVAGWSLGVTDGLLKLHMLPDGSKYCLPFEGSVF